jgi:hypothetical protein
MSTRPALFICVTGAGSCRTAGELIAGAIAAGWETYTVATPNVGMITDVAALLDVPGSTSVRDYGYPPLERFPFGTMLVAPCTFNTLNKLAHGIADTLLTAMVADALGAGCPIFIAPALNRGLWNHPQTALSLERLRAWGCSIIEPSIAPERVSVAANEIILARLHLHFAQQSNSNP